MAFGHEVIREQSTYAARKRLEDTFKVPDEMDGALTTFRQLLAEYEQAHEFNVRWFAEFIRDTMAEQYVATEMALTYYKLGGYDEAAKKAERVLADTAKRWHIAHALCVYFKHVDLQNSAKGLAEFFKQRREEDKAASKKPPKGDKT